MNCSNWQVWAGNAARAEGERNAGHRTGTVTAFRFGGFLNCTAAGRAPEGGTRGKRARLALTGPSAHRRRKLHIVRFPAERESSFIPLRLLSPRKASRLPRGPFSRRALPTFPRWKVGRRRRRRRKFHIIRFAVYGKAHSFRCGSSPHERRPAFRGAPFPGGFWVLFAGEKYLPEGYSLARLKWNDGFPLIRPLRGHLPPSGKAWGNALFDVSTRRKAKEHAARWHGAARRKHYTEKGLRWG